MILDNLVIESDYDADDVVADLLGLQKKTKGEDKRSDLPAYKHVVSEISDIFVIINKFKLI